MLGTQSVRAGIPTRSVGTRIVPIRLGPRYPCCRLLASYSQRDYRAAVRPVSAPRVRPRFFRRRAQTAAGPRAGLPAGRPRRSDAGKARSSVERCSRAAATLTGREIPGAASCNLTLDLSGDVCRICRFTLVPRRSGEPSPPFVEFPAFAVVCLGITPRGATE